MMLVVYQKANGEIIRRKINTYPAYKVGERTSMGWKVLEILYHYKGYYYSKNDYDFLVDKDIVKRKKITKIKRTILKIYDNLIYPMALLILLKLLELISK